MNGKASGTDSSLSCNDTIRAFLSKHQTKIEMAVRESQKSNHRHKLGAVIFKGKRIISNGFNKTTSWRRKLHPKQKKWDTSIHAEADAILNARHDLNGCEMVVVRVNKNGRFLKAKPCLWCMNYISHVGIKRVYYSISSYPYIDVIEI